MSDKLTMPRYRVRMTDGTVHELQATNADLVSFDRERARHRDWPTPSDGPFFFQNYITWKALTRLGQIDLSLSAYEKDAVEIAPIPDKDGDADVDPTQPEAGPGWSSP